MYNQYHSTVFILQDRCDVYWTEWLFNLPIIIFFFTLCYRPFSPKFGRSTSDRISSMSPAAQKLAHSRLGIRSSTDKALRASYTPSPSHTLPGSKTPISLTPSGTPKSSTPSVKGTPGSKRGVGDVQSLTDNLLQIPKRPKAADFFEWFGLCAGMYNPAHCINTEMLVYCDDDFVENIVFTGQRQQKMFISLLKFYTWTLKWKRSVKIY